MTTTAAASLLFVTVGTDHHRFDRLITWVDEWLRALPPDRVGCVMQTGTSVPSRQAQSRDYLGHEELVAHMGTAAAVVCHGGPATIMDARRAGNLPIVVPRERRLGEHVDDHQVRFAGRMAPTGHIALARSRPELHAALDAVLADPLRYRLGTEDGGNGAAVDRFADLVTRLVGQQPAGLSDSASLGRAH